MGDAGLSAESLALNFALEEFQSNYIRNMVRQGERCQRVNRNGKRDHKLFKFLFFNFLPHPCVIFSSSFLPFLLLLHFTSSFLLHHSFFIFSSSFSSSSPTLIFNLFVHRMTSLTRMTFLSLVAATYSSFFFFPFYRIYFCSARQTWCRSSATATALLIRPGRLRYGANEDNDDGFRASPLILSPECASSRQTSTPSTSSSTTRPQPPCRRKND
jgi:hypothetical protein